MTKFLTLAAVCALTVLTAGCGTSAPSTFYTLDLTAPPKEKIYKSAQQPVLGVESVALAAYLDRPQIVLKAADSPVVTLNEFNRWSESLNTAVARVLSNAVNQTAKRPYAKPITTSRAPYAYILSVELLRLDADFGKNAVLEAWWTISDKNDAPVYTMKTVLTHPAGETYDSVVRAENALVTELGKIIASYCLKNLDKK